MKITGDSESPDTADNQESAQWRRDRERVTHHYESMAEETAGSFINTIYPGTVSIRLDQYELHLLRAGLASQSSIDTHYLDHKLATGLRILEGE